MRKNPLSEGEMSDAAYQTHSELLHQEMRGPGDMEAAMYRLQSRYGLDYWKQWQARYRRSAAADFIEKMRQAKLDMIAKSVRRDVEYLKTEKEKGAGNADLTSLLVEAEGLLAKIQAAKVKR